VSCAMQDIQSRKVLVTFGVRVREARLAKGLSQEDLAEIAGLHRTYIGTVERGERNPALVNLVRIADALSIDLSALTNGLSLSSANCREVRK
jgi:transcriptional regulator with XRE-family HTH domain